MPPIDGAYARGVLREKVIPDRVPRPVLDVDPATLEPIAGVPVTPENIVRDQGVLAVSAPDAADRVGLEDILEDAVSKAEGELEPVGGGVRQVVPDEQVVVVAQAGVILRVAALAQSLTPRERKDPIARVRA